MAEEKVLSKGAVVYTDGSCIGNPGAGGSGAHGYIYEIGKEAGKIKHDTIETFITTTRSYINGRGDPLNAVKEKLVLRKIDLVQPIKYFDMVTSIPTTTNNRAEVTALINALESLATLDLSVINIHIDSTYTIGMLEKAMKNRENTIVNANVDLYKRLLTIVTKCKESKIKLYVHHVKGHSNNLGNDRADVLANIGTNIATTDESSTNMIYSDSKKYWTYVEDVSPMITHTRCLFNSKEIHNTVGTYYLADPGPNELLLGKRISETGLSIVKLNESDSIIECIKEKQFLMSNGFNSIIMLPIDRVYHKSVYGLLTSFKGHCLVKNKRFNSLNFVNGSAMTTEVNPTGLSLGAIEAFNVLEEVFSNYINKNSTTHNAIDITEQLYTTEEKKNKSITVLKKELSVGEKQIDVSVLLNDSNIEIPLVLGVDIASRNKLKRLESYTPVVKLVLWSIGPSSFRYCTIIETSLGSGIWSNYYADRIFTNNKPI